MKPTAILRNWRAHPNAHGHYYTGEVFEDTKGRFRDGSKIHTSQVKGEEILADGRLVITLNSVYFLPNGSEAR